MEDNNRDYYFLVINKENNRNIFFNSLKKLYELNPNGNNLPFQCVWNKNREKVNRTYEESKNFIMKNFYKSAKKRAKLFFDFEEYKNKKIEPKKCI
ncbi:hypothetical protein [Metamycoplasma hyosynoviae]|uniref:hypothetical protein n=1 Tax=Metamycoplasma hyosynoviae TaxID=29559 RepID=UPI002365D059|nr:hypothetical protein [Metamycoplasma hyosynoviae]MDD7847374.1 hypothetical protein [Metamycoplasma hyosynoviae]MDD7894084.1 hypothetical protein [Metamycoplasma hyosynoviae]